MPVGTPVVRTARGDIPPDGLGMTLMHEHVLCDVTPPALAAAGGAEVEITLENVWEIRHHWCAHLGNNRLLDEADAIFELGRFKAAGGGTVVDVTTTGIKPAPAALRRVAAASGVNVVVGCGYYTEEFLDPALRSRGVDEFASEMIDSIRAGISGSDVRAGIIGEIGCSDPWTPLERRIMKAAVLAQRETGAALTVHPGRRANMPVEIARFVAAEGGDVSRLVIGHVDRTIFDDDALFALADAGCVIEYDFFGIEQAYYPFQDIDLPNDGARLRAIRRLIARGHLGQILMSHDICTRTRLCRYGGHGYAHIPNNVVPMMRSREFSSDQIEAILVATPARLLSISAP